MVTLNFLTPDGVVKEDGNSDDTPVEAKKNTFPGPLMTGKSKSRTGGGGGDLSCGRPKAGERRSLCLKGRGGAGKVSENYKD